MPAPVSRLRTWLQLVRAPNLFTVPGDPIAGYLLSNDGFTDFSLALVALACLCFYAAGLLMNDVVDLAEDTAERPNRPLPAGHASPTSALKATWILNALGIVLLIFTQSTRSLFAGLFLVAFVWLYNNRTKHIPLLGAMNMGICRGLSIMVGAYAGPSPSAALIVSVFAIVVTFYIAAVTNLARFETAPSIPAFPRLLPILPLCIGCVFGARNATYAPDKTPAAAIFFLAIFGGILLMQRLLSKNAPPLPPLVGAHIRLLLPLQAAICWLGASQSSGPTWAIIFLCCWPLSKIVSRRFYAS